MAFNIDTVTVDKSVEASRPSRKVMPGNPEFELVHHADHWNFVDDTGEFLPGTLSVQKMPGVNGTDRRGGIGILRNHFNERGSVLLSLGDNRLGKWKNYLRKVTNDANRKHHFTMWENPTVIGNRVMWEHDVDDARAFARHLVDAGVVAPMPEALRSMFLDRQNRKIEGLRARNAPAKQIAEEEARYRAMAEGKPLADCMDENKAPKRRGKAS